MRKILPILLVAAVLGAAASSAYLAPLYPVYAQNTSREASSPGLMRDVKTLEKAGNQVMGDEGKVASRAAALRAKLLKFKDKAKAARTENINTSLNNINQRRTTTMTQNLARLSQILEKLKTQAEAAGAAGKNVTELNSAIADVEAQWTEADAAAKAQAENDYSIAVNTEATVKEDAKEARDALHTDLKAVHTQILGVRQSLANAIQSALNLMGGNNGT